MNDDEKVMKELPNGYRIYKRRPGKIKAIEMKEPFLVDTLEGTMHGKPGDFLIEGISGELYICKADIFYDLYEDAPLELLDEELSRMDD